MSTDYCRGPAPKTVPQGTAGSVLILAVLAAALGLGPAWAAEPPSPPDSTPAPASGMWERLYSQGLSAATGVGNWLGMLPAPEAAAEREAQTARFRETWERLLPKLDDAMRVVAQREQAPGMAFFSKDRQDFDREYARILDQITTILEGAELLEYQRRTTRLKRRIREVNEEISRLFEARLVAPDSGLFVSTKGDLTARIERHRAEIADYEASIVATRKDLVAGLMRIGIPVSDEQAEVLLARVDASNILQMAEVFDTLKGVTSQLARIMASSGENVDHLRYYGMHVVLLEVALHMQARYISAIDEIYLPRLNEIVAKASEINRESIRALRGESSHERREVYKSNLLANQLTIETARLYMDRIRSQRRQVARAHDRLSRDLALARNTYETVSVSTELLSILEASQRSFDALTQLDISEIVPFTNAQVLKKFEEISAVIGDG